MILNKVKEKQGEAITVITVREESFFLLPVFLWSCFTREMQVEAQVGVNLCEISRSARYGTTTGTT